MRVGIAAHLLRADRSYRSAGVSVYIDRLLRQLPQSCPQHTYLSFQSRAAPQIPGTHAVVAPLSLRQPLTRIVWEQTVLPVQAFLQHVDLLHGAVNVVPLRATMPTVVTVHDLSFIRFPERFPRLQSLYLRTATTATVRRADHIIAVSNSTKRELVELLRVPEEKVSVVYSGASSRFRPLPAEDIEDFRHRALGGRPFILHVGTLQPRKNIDVLIRSYAEARSRGRIPHALALVGARGWMYEELFELVDKGHLKDDVIFVDRVDDSELPLWYNACDLFAYPSAYEGFGLPVLEAMACGVPVITSASSALEELAGDACVTVPPGSQEALAAALMRVLEDRDLHGELCRKGRERASLFSWENSARQTVRVYERVAGVMTA